MEGGVEHGYHGHIVAHHFTACHDTGDVGRVVQRSKRRALLNGFHHSTVNPYGRGKLLSAVNHTVANSVNLLHGADHAVFLAGELVDNGCNGFRMGGQADVFIINRLVSYQRGVLQVSVDTDSLAKAFRHDGFGLHIDQLVLEGGAACVDNKNFHRWVSFRIVNIINLRYNIL